MNRFTIRVELFDTQYDDNEYEILHEAMKKKGFTRTIVDSETKVEYYLPPAEYNFSGDQEKDEVASLASAAAKTTGHKFSILVTKSGGRQFENLKPVRKLKTK